MEWDCQRNHTCRLWRGLFVAARLTDRGDCLPGGCSPSAYPVQVCAVAAPPPPRRDSRPSAAPWRRAVVGPGGSASSPGPGALLLLLIVFYQPILCAVIPFAARTFRSEGFTCRSSSSWAAASLDGVARSKISASRPTAPGPIEKCSGRSARTALQPADPHPPAVSTLAFIEDVTLHDADVVYAPGNSPPPKPKKKEPFSLPPLPIPHAPEPAQRQLPHAVRPARNRARGRSGRGRFLECAGARLAHRLGGHRRNRRSGLARQRT